MDFLVSLHYHLIRYFKKLNKDFDLILVENNTRRVYATGLNTKNILPYMSLFDEWENPSLIVGFDFFNDRQRFEIYLEFKLQDEVFIPVKSKIYELVKYKMSTKNVLKKLIPTDGISSKEIAKVISKFYIERKQSNNG